MTLRITRVDGSASDETEVTGSLTLTLNTNQIEDKEPAVLDFDLETIAAGFADPDWVPQKITCAAWSWVGSGKVESRICGPLGIYGKSELRREMLEPLLEEIAKADYVTGHNINRFDLPVLNAECMRLGLKPVQAVRTQDTIRLYRSKGFKKSQDNLGDLFGTADSKLHLNWQNWEDGYDEIGDNLKDLLDPSGDGLWSTIRSRAEIDVMQHIQLREILLDRGIIMDPRMWYGKKH